MTTKELTQKIINLIEHIDAMKDDAYLIGHPEWHEIVKEALEIKGGQ